MMDAAQRALGTSMVGHYSDSRSGEKHAGGRWRVTPTTNQGRVLVWYGSVDRGQRVRCSETKAETQPRKAVLGGKAHAAWLSRHLDTVGVPQFALLDGFWRCACRRSAMLINHPNSHAFLVILSVASMRCTLRFSFLCLSSNAGVCLFHGLRRRRACWHLLRCVWSVTRRFRSVEDALESMDTARSPVETRALKALFEVTSDRHGKHRTYLSTLRV